MKKIHGSRHLTTLVFRQNNNTSVRNDKFTANLNVCKIQRMSSYLSRHKWDIWRPLVKLKHLCFYAFFVTNSMMTIHNHIMLPFPAIFPGSPFPSALTRWRTVRRWPSCTAKASWWQWPPWRTPTTPRGHPPTCPSWRYWLSSPTSSSSKTRKLSSTTWRGELARQCLPGKEQKHKYDHINVWDKLKGHKLIKLPCKFPFKNFMY